MIVIGVDVHKQSVTAVAIDDAGRMLDERTVPAGSDELRCWAAGLAMERLWARRQQVLEMGCHARETLRLHQIDWDHVIAELLA